MMRTAALGVILTALVVPASAREARAQAEPPAPPEKAGWVDVHTHFTRTKDFAAAAAEAVRMMDENGIQATVMMPQPMGGAGMESAYDCADFAAALKEHPGRFAFLGGGDVLGAMIQSAKSRTEIDDALREEFEKKAQAILDLGAAGFGELTAHHLSYNAQFHPFLEAPADHPLFLLLADIAARNDAVIDFHYDPVATEKKTPSKYPQPPNPETMKPNMEAFEKLLSHNPKTRIVWAHMGSDPLGDWTVELTRGLLERHPNLFISIRLSPGADTANAPVDDQGKLKAEWLKILQDYSDRFVLGLDLFISEPSASGASTGGGQGAESGMGPGSGRPGGGGQRPGGGRPMGGGQRPGGGRPTGGGPGAGQGTGAGGMASVFAQRAKMTVQMTRQFMRALPEDLARKIGRENAERLYKLAR